MKTSRFLEMVSDLDHEHLPVFVEDMAVDQECGMLCPYNRWAAKQRKTIRNSREWCEAG